MPTEAESTVSAETLQKDLTSLMSSARGELVRIADRAEEAEKSGRVPEETFLALEKSGVHRFIEPRDLGGYGLPFEPFFQTVSEISGACGSTGWVFVLFAVHNWMLQFQPRRVLSFIYKDGKPGRLATSFVSGGIVSEKDGKPWLEGKWPYVSGVHLADWVRVKAGDEQGGVVHAFLPCGSFDVAEDWNPAGLRATNSQSISFSGPVDPEWLVPDREMEEAFYARTSMPEGSTLPMEVVVAVATVAPIIGMTRGCVSFYEKILRNRGIRENLHPGALERLARLSVEGMSLQLLHRECTRMLDKTPNGLTLTALARAEIRMNAAWITARCRAIVSETMASSGTRSNFHGNPMLRHALGVMTLCTYFFVEYDGLATNYGLARVNKVQKKPLQP